MQMNQTYGTPRGVAESTATPVVEASLSHMAQVQKYLGQHAPLPPADKLAHSHSITLPGAVPSVSIPAADTARPHARIPRNPSDASLASIAPLSLVLQELEK